MSTNVVSSVKPSPVRDVYRFGNGPEPVLQPGTMGWSAADLEDPVLRRLWDEGRFEILDGVLTIMPAVFYIGGECAANLVYLLRSHLRDRKVPSTFSFEVDIQISEPYLLRADAVGVFGDDLPKFRALKFKVDNDWRRHALLIPPTFVVESVSKGNELHDRKTKRKWYAEFGVRHYWIVDAYAKSLECLILQGDQYRTDAAGVGADVVSLQSFPGLKLSLDEVWGDHE